MSNIHERKVDRTGVPKPNTGIAFARIHRLFRKQHDPGELQLHCGADAVRWPFKITGLTKFLGGLLILAVLGTTVQAAQNVTLAWNASPSSDVTGYRVYYGASSGNYSNSVVVGNVTTNTVPGLASGATYFFAVTAYNAIGLESLFSNEIGYTVPSTNTSPLMTIWPSTAAPAIADNGADNPVELGVQFRSDVAGSITGIRFYKASANMGTHVGNLWTSTGTLLATATFAGESASGWQQVLFATPVAITANTVYVASYHANTGHYSDDKNYFSANGVDNPPLHALANSVSGGNGVYAYGSSSSFPNGTWSACNYWVDVVCQPGLAPTLTSMAVTPSNPSLLVGASQQFTAIGTYSDGSTQNLTSQATWTSSSTAVAAVNAGGLATAASAGATTISAMRSGVTGSSTLTVILNPPTIVLTAPANGAVYTGPVTISLAASVTANGHAITKVQFYNGATLLNEDTSAPYSFTWNSVSAGSYSLTARAVYDAGSIVASSPANVTVVNPAPTVVLTSPTNGATYTAPATMNLAAGVTVNGHSITKVQFYNGVTLLGEDTSAPYSLTYSNVSAGSYSLTARAVYDAGSTVDSSPANINVMGLPAPWQTADIGSVSAAGSASMSNGIYTVKGAGNISGTADNFRFVYQPLSADGEIKSRLNSVGNTGTSGRIGVMIRESLTSGSKYAFMGISPDCTFRWQRRSSTGGNTSTTTSTIGTPSNIWIRLVRTGNTLYGYKSTDGTNWTLVNSHSITMATNIYVGLAVASGSSNTLNTATFTNVTVIP
jgi:Domain of unknown function (DUF4082)/Bacterial Ig domain/Bacterial Ig-like domain (group 2)/Fibronectin type III domain